MLTDFVAVEYANGPALACQSFRRHMENRGHHVGLIGPKPSKHREASGETILLDSWRFRQYGNVPFAMPWYAQLIANDRRTISFARSTIVF